MSAKYQLKSPGRKVGIQVTLREPDGKTMLASRGFSLDTDAAQDVFETIQRALCGKIVVPWKRPAPRLKRNALKEMKPE